jgi:hypothetical protein
MYFCLVNERSVLPLFFGNPFNIRGDAGRVKKQLTTAGEGVKE